jgi:hypothetical protein
MPDLQFELDRLREADDHLARVRKDIAEMEHVVAQQEAEGFDTSVAQQTLDTARRGHEALQQHRDLIASIVDDVRARRLPG